MEMDLSLIALLLVLVVHCQSTRITVGVGRPYIISTPNGRKYFRMFAGYRYLTQDGVIQDTFREQSVTAERCLLMCHQHNQNSQRSDPRCIAVNYCPRSSNCQLDTDTERVPPSNPRCMLISVGLVPGENVENVVSMDKNWNYPVDYSYYETFGQTPRTTLTISRGVTKDYYYYFGRRYTPQENRVIQDLIRKGREYTGEDCLKNCHKQSDCVAVNFCTHSENCRLPTDTANQPPKFARCILLSAGLDSGLDAAGHLAVHDPHWDHYYDNSLSTYDYGF